MQIFCHEHSLEEPRSGSSGDGIVLQLRTLVLIPYECGHEAMTYVMTFEDF